MLKYYLFLFNYSFEKKLPVLSKHLKSLDIPDEVWISKWFQTLFTICLPFEAICRLWDCLASLGLDFLIKFSIALLQLLEPKLLKNR